MDAAQLRNRDFRMASGEKLQHFLATEGADLPPHARDFILGLIQSRNGNVQGALDAFIAATEANPREWAYPLELGRLLVQTGESLDEPAWCENALLSLRRAVEIEPAEPEIFLLLADAYEQLGRSREAIANLRRAADLLIQPQQSQHHGNPEQKYPANWPLVLHQDIHFFRFKTHGNCDRLLLESLCEDGRHVFCCALWGYSANTYPWNGQRTRIVEEGTLTTSRLNEVLDNELKAILSLAPQQQFPYAIWKIV